MATITLKKKNTSPASKDSKPGERRAPLRGKGVSRPRQTLEQAQAERRERQAAFEARQRDEQGGSRPPRRDDERSGPRGRNEEQRRDGRPYGDRATGDRPRADRPQGAGFRRDERGPEHAPRRGEAPARGDRGNRGNSSDPRQGYEPRDQRDRRERPTGPGRDQRQDQRRGSGPREAWGGDQRDQRNSRDQQHAPQADQRRDPRSGPGGYRDGRGEQAGHGPSERRRYDRPAGPGEQAQAPRPRRESRAIEPNAEGERLSKRMSELGMASRREADEWIAAGWVKVNGKLAELGLRVGPEVHIEIDPAAHKEQAKQITILLHKPIGYVSGQAEDGYEPASVLVKSDTHWSEDPSGLKYHHGHGRGLAPAGRLDIDSTGLLVLTQDGRVAKQLIGDDSIVEKEYLVRVEYLAAAPAEGEAKPAPMHQFPAEALERLNHGLELDGVQLKPAKVSWANEDQLRFVLREGRKRQIRRMCELVGLKVLALKRVRIGQVVLGKLPVGQWRYLSPWERF
ncbi:pseudouridine synthase [Paucibacter sp. APW11]|uniref:Dual-specificity RNA pseudouridine synthase RluF n=1 Tax=Roseateles aquae TaxID=3077235 RepID=A0ABU3P525_9BURK|nr:pseudouridine synthase [Paucibacter sp. APW11]MDT8997669.1 pseudouridine synthase [Paucibacter sp. APW11]